MSANIRLSKATRRALDYEQRTRRQTRGLCGARFRLPDGGFGYCDREATHLSPHAGSRP